MRHGTGTIVYALASCLLLTVATQAATITIDKVEASQHTSLPTAYAEEPVGIVAQTEPIEGKTLLRLVVSYTVDWREKDREISLPEEKVVIVNEAGEKVPVAGFCFDGEALRVRTHRMSRVKIRRSDGGAEDSRKTSEQMTSALVFVVGANEKQWTLRIGDAEHPVRVNRLAVAPDPLGAFTAEVVESHWTQSIKVRSTPMSYEDDGLRTTITPATGRFLMVTVVFSAQELRSDSFSFNAHFWLYPHNFGLLTPRGAVVTPIGVLRGSEGELRLHPRSTAIQVDRADVGSDQARHKETLLFAVPPARRYTLMHLGQRVAAFSTEP